MLHEGSRMIARLLVSSLRLAPAGLARRFAPGATVAAVSETIEGLVEMTPFAESP